MDTPGSSDDRPVFRPISSYTTTQVDWLSRGRLARGKLTDLSGPGGGGKSSLMVEWVARITRGHALPDGEAHPPAGVVLVANEDDPSDTLRPRLEVAGADLSLVLVLDAEAGPTPFLPEGVADYEEACLAIGAALIVFDPVTNVLNPRLNQHKDSDVRTGLMPLVLMLRRLNIAGVNIRHVNKSASNDPAMRAAGSTAFLNLARIGLLLAPDPENPDRVVLAPTKANLARRSRSLAFSHEPVAGTGVARLRLLGETDTTASQLLTVSDPEARGKKADARVWLEEFLSGGMQSSKEISRAAEGAKISGPTLRRAREEMKEEGRIKPVKINKPGSPIGEWFWSLPTRQDAQSQPPQESQDDQDAHPAHTGNVEHLGDHLARRAAFRPTGTEGD